MAARIIVRIPYLKNNAGAVSYAKYIATREGVDKSINLRLSNQPVTKKQEELIANLLRDFPDIKNSYEYEEYEQEPTKENASEFITTALEQQVALFDNPQIYAKYIATRPGAEKHGTHGLFGNQEQVQLPEVLRGLERHNGNVWTPIISLRREDAARLGYDSAEAWRTLLMEKQTELAKAFKIPIGNFRWYAAFHDEGHHPHIHMLVYSTEPRQGFIAEEGIEKIKSVLATQIFKQDLYQLYDNKDESRKKISQETEHKLEKLSQKIKSKDYASSPIAERLVALADLMQNVKGKKQYSYLKPEQKKQVDEIVKEMFLDNELASLYSSWCKYQNEIAGIYKGTVEQPPLWENKEFRKIKNLIITKAAMLGETLP